MTEPTSPEPAEQDIGALDNETIFDPTDVPPAVVDHHADGETGRDPFFATDAGEAWLDEHERGVAG